MHKDRHDIGKEQKQSAFEQDDLPINLNGYCGHTLLRRRQKWLAAGRRIDYQQRLVRRVRIEFAQSAFYLQQLGHQICFRVLAASSVAKQKVDLLRRSPLMRVVTKGRGICTVLAANYFNAES